LYGDIWLLEQVAAKTGVRQDLEAVFDGNIELADDILTLAMFPYLTKHAYNRVARWQRNANAPSTRELTPSLITRLTQTITEQHRMELLKLRALRIEKGELCSVDSTSRPAYGDSLADIRWGKNKENLPLPQTTEVVVYALSSHMPVYYRTFPGNIPDTRTLDVILKDLEHAGFKNLVLVTDRGYESIRNLEQFILRGQSIIMCTKNSQKDVAKAIAGLGVYDTIPNSMLLDCETRLFYSQFNIDYKVETKGHGEKSANKLKLNLYFDPERRTRQIIDLDIAVTTQELSLNDIKLNKKQLPDDYTLKKIYTYFILRYDPLTRELYGYKKDEKKIAKSKLYSGYFSIMTHGLNYDPIKTLNCYSLRDEQEKYFQQMKSQMVSDRQRNWSEEGKTGRLLILFVSLILSSYVRHIWKSTSLHNQFSSSLDILDEMRSIRYIQHTNRAKIITPFVGAQLEICKAFGFEVPEGCAPTYVSRQKPTNRKRGRPPKKLVELSL
jgi:hypothetical protein